MSEFITEYDLTVKETPVTVGGTKYILREASEDAACQYRNAAVRGAKMVNGTVTMGDAGNVQALLVSLCLFEVNDLGDTFRVTPLVTVKGWPARVVRPLFDWIKRESMLDESKDGDAAKN